MKDRFLQITLNRSAASAFAKREASKAGVGASLARLRLAGNFCRLPDILIETKYQTPTMHYKRNELNTTKDSTRPK